MTNHLNDKKKIIENYLNAFNLKNKNEMINLLTEDIVHEINQGEVQIGKDKFRDFMNHMNECYQEQITEINIICSENSTTIAAEYLVTGTYIKTDRGLPVAKKQKYAVKAGCFFDLKDNLISRVTLYYNLPLWIKMVSKE
jgi:steroid delta-isomerase-like uncharacterized protein